MARPISTTRSLTLAEKLQSWSDDEFDPIVRDAAEDDAKAIGFRHASVATQKRQDRHLKLYYDYMRSKSPSLTMESAEELVLPIAFPADQAVFITQCRQFLSIVFKHASPKSNQAKMIRYTTLMTYRSSLLFWTPRKLEEQSITPPAPWVLFKQMSEVMRSIYARFGPEQQPQKA